MVFIHTEHREQRELKSVRLEESRLEVDKQRVSQNLQNNNPLFDLQVDRIDIDKWRVDLDEQRIHMEKQERSVQLEASKQLAVLLGKLAD